MTESIQYYGPSGTILSFYNTEELYPVNRYQSLLLATNTYTEVLTYSAEMKHPLSNVRAAEICCGGGPVAITLKAAGVGYVEASDINPRALAACHYNAKQNGLKLDQIVKRDMLEGINEEPEKFNVIACNPPCSRTDLRPEGVSPDLLVAVSGGEGGINFIERLLEQCNDCITDDGRLIFVLTSTMSFIRVVNLLNTYFPGSWRQSYHTPVAQPFVREGSAISNQILELAANREIFAWDGQDGWIWRMTWIIVARKSDTKWGKIKRTGLWLRPNLYDIELPEFKKLLAHFNKLPSTEST